MTSPPAQTGATPSALAQTAPPILPAFTSSFSAFNLSARHPPEPNAFPPPSPMQTDASAFYDMHGSSAGQGAPFGRKLSSKLGSEMMIPLGSQEAAESSQSREGGLEEGQDGVEGGDSMVLGSPTFGHPSLPNLAIGLPPPTSNYWGTASSEGRSRSASVSMRDSASVPASPVAVSSISRAALQRTPPPFLQRRLFNGDEDISSNSSNSSGQGMKIVDSEEDFEIVPDETGEVEIDSVGLGLSSTSERVVRRPVSRRPNLLPKPKSHLRVLSQLRAEDGPADSLEIASEATLHRLSRSCASTVPVIRPTTGTPISSNSSGDARVPGSSSGGLSHSKPTPNRFPEQADEEEDKRDDSEGSVEGEAEEGSEFGGMSMGYTTEDEDEQRKSVMWTGIRGGNHGGNGNFGINAGVRGSPSSERGKMEMDYNSPSSTPGWQNSARPGKRKCAFSSFLSLESR